MRSSIKRISLFESELTKKALTLFCANAILFLDTKIADYGHYQGRISGSGPHTLTQIVWEYSRGTKPSRAMPRNC